MGDPRQRPTRLVLLCDRRIAREALAAYFAARPGFAVLGHAADSGHFRELCALTSPQAALVEVEPLDGDTLRTLHAVRAEVPDMHVVVTYTELPRRLLTDAVRAGVASFVPSSSGLDAIASMLQCRAGRQRDRRTDGGKRLTTRELAIVALLSSGHTTADIAALLQISPHTVDNHKRRIYAKLGVGSQGLAVARAVSLGLLPTPGLASHGPPEQALVPHLTARERDVLWHIVQGHTTRRAATALGIAVKTVENTQARVYRKLGTHNRAETMTVAYQLGLADPAPAR